MFHLVGKFIEIVKFLNFMFVASFIIVDKLDRQVIRIIEVELNDGFLNIVIKEN